MISPSFVGLAGGGFVHVIPQSLTTSSSSPFSTEGVSNASEPLTVQVESTQPDPSALLSRTGGLVQGCGVGVSSSFLASTNAQTLSLSQPPLQNFSRGCSEVPKKQCGDAGELKTEQCSTQVERETPKDAPRKGLCALCGAASERFDYVENGVSFPALKCSEDCGWWA